MSRYGYSVEPDGTVTILDRDGDPLGRIYQSTVNDPEADASVLVDHLNEPGNSPEPYTFAQTTIRYAPGPVDDDGDPETAIELTPVEIQDPQGDMIAPLTCQADAEAILTHLNRNR